MRRLLEILKAFWLMDWDGFIEEEVRRESVIEHWAEVGEDSRVEGEMGEEGE